MLGYTIPRYLTLTRSQRRFSFPPQPSLSPPLDSSESAKLSLTPRRRKRQLTFRQPLDAHRNPPSCWYPHSEHLHNHARFPMLIRVRIQQVHVDLHHAQSGTTPRPRFALFPPPFISLLISRRGRSNDEGETNVARKIGERLTTRVCFTRGWYRSRTISWLRVLDKSFLWICDPLRVNLQQVCFGEYECNRVGERRKCSTGSARKVLAMHHPIFANPGRRSNSLPSPFLHASVR